MEMTPDNFYCPPIIKRVYVEKKRLEEKKNHWYTNEMNLCKLQLNMPHKVSLYIRTKLCNGGKGF